VAVGDRANADQRGRGQVLTVVEHQEYGGPAPAFAGAATVTSGLQLSITEPAAPAVYALQASTDLVN